MEATGLSLWLLPDGPLAERLAGRIADLASAAGTPTFPPHVTIVGQVTDAPDAVAHAARGIARRHRPLELVVGLRAGQPTWFRSLYLEVEPTPELRDLRADACRAFHRDPAGFRPHLSLRYGDPEPGEPVRDVETGRRFTAGTLHLWSTEGRVDAWHRIARFDLARS